MKRIMPLAVVFIFLVFASFCSAGLIIEGDDASTCWDDGDGVLQCGDTTFGTDGDDYTLAVTGDHYDHLTGGERELHGHLIGDFNVDGDPILGVTNYIDNQTDFAWTDYHVKITMGIPFSVIGVSVANVGWTTDPDVPPSFDATEVTTGTYVAEIDYYGGTPVPQDNLFQFGYTLQFDSSAIDYCIEYTPTPEPASLALLLSGLMLGGFVWLRRR